jgi:copper resistance protein D
MSLLFDIFGYLEVVLRGFATTSQTVAVGGVLFLIFLARPLAPKLPTGQVIIARVLRLIGISALALAGIELVAAVIQILVLRDTMAISLIDAAGANFALSAAVRTFAALGLGLMALTEQHNPRTAKWLVLAFAIVAASVARSHAMGRLDDRWELLIVGFVHQAGAALWIGGIPYFIAALARLNDGAAWRVVGRRFSIMSMIAVAAIGIAGVTMSAFYFDSLEAIYGTAYGLMTAAKVVMFLALLGLGAMNYRLVERLRIDPGTPIARLRRFAEVELAVGVTVFFTAASLLSLPPAIDLPDDRASLSEIVERFTPQWPRLSSPDRLDTSIPVLQAQLDAQAAAGASAARAYVPGAGLPKPRNAADMAWSEYNHNWAGFFVFAIGLLALAHRSGYAPWAKHWPLIFLLLAAFLFIRSDPKYWPLGDINWFEGLRDAEAVQHRVVVLLIVAFALFEWAVRTGRLTRPVYTYVFPVGAAIGATLLLTHQHPLSNIREALLVEFTHTPLAILGVTSAWSRWLELRLERPGNVAAGYVWPICFLIIGFMLITYRES